MAGSGWRRTVGHICEGTCCSCPRCEVSPSEARTARCALQGSGRAEVEREVLFAVSQTCRVLQSARYGGPPRIETGTGYSCDLEDAEHMLPAAMGDCLLARRTGDLCKMRTIPWSLERGRSSVDASAGVWCRGEKEKL
jgi:hypothetical protein